LQEIELQDLPTTIYNPFHLPKAGSDDPHQGVDFSEVEPQSRISLEGMAVQSILAGKVVQVMEDRFPYGNAVLVVSGPVEIPLSWLAAINKMENPSPWRANPALSCPQGWEDAPEQKEQIHLFVLYAHLKNATDVQVEDRILTGQLLGEIGMSGNALAPHLHVEIRYAYSEAIPDSMAHYDVSATAPEMMQYCRWRVSGWYRPLDPMSLLLLKVD
jgi:murein DD-endopeptidase MepM/ murein hydrolase activator NlpD